MKTDAEKLFFSRRTMRNLPAFLQQEYGPQKGVELQQKMLGKLAEMLVAQAADSPELRQHTHQRILPLIALYTVLCEVKMQQDALKLTEELYLADAHKPARTLRKVLKLPLLYKKVPSFFAAMTKRSFGERCGFQAVYHQADAKGLAFDMHKCVYYDTCQKYGCPELTAIFCHLDDVMYGNMHPKLHWARSKTIGEGAELCDFRLWVRQ